ncbi:MAG: flavodoxin [Clostridia bacterium]|nr:flavodoxin [Clostridia bacterium]
MKSVLSMILTFATLFALSACSSPSAAPAPAPAENSAPVQSAAPAQSAAPEENAVPEESPVYVQSVELPAQSTEAADAGKVLVAYFSKTGNTEAVANMIAAATGGTLFKVETVTPYPEDYNETVDIARNEQDNDARPALSTHVENMADYDVIYLGYPNWWGTMPQAMFTFLEEYDFSGKTIAPFCTHGGSALGRSEGDIAALVPDATLLPGFAVSGSRAAGAQADVEAWLGGLDIA